MEMAIGECVWSASGVDVADWNNLQIFVPKEGGPPDHYFGLMPKSDYEIVDDWFVTGLAATGSRSIKMTEVFIPDERLQFTPNIKGGETPGSAINPSNFAKQSFKCSTILPCSSKSGNAIGIFASLEM